MPLLILPINYKLFSYFIAIPFFRWHFCFTQQGISRCRIFCHSAISTSIIPSIGSMCGPRFLSKFSGSFRHKSLIKMIKYSLFEWIKSFFKFSTICLSNLFGYFCKVAYPKIWWSHWHRQVQREIRDKIEEYKKSGTEKKGKRGENTVEWAWLDDELLEEREKRLTSLHWPSTITSFSQGF